MERLTMICAVLFLGAGCSFSSGRLTVMDTVFKQNGTHVRIALLPPRMALGATSGIAAGSQRIMGQHVTKIFTEQTSSAWLTPDETSAAVQNANALPEYEAFLDGFQRTGVPSKDRLKKIGAAVNHPYVALCNLNYRVTQIITTGYFGTVSTKQIRIAEVTLQVFKVDQGTLVFEAIGSATSESVLYETTEELFEMAAMEVIKYFPGYKPPVKQEKQDKNKH